MMFLRCNCFEFMYSGKLKEGHFALFLGEILSPPMVLNRYWKTICGGKLAQFLNATPQK